jgi:hypothetical protein
VVVHTYNLTRETEGGGLQVWGHPGLHSKTLYHPSPHKSKSEMSTVHP